MVELVLGLIKLLSNRELEWLGNHLAARKPLSAQVMPSSMTLLGIKEDRACGKTHPSLPSPSSDRFSRTSAPHLLLRPASHHYVLPMDSRFRLGPEEPCLTVFRS